MIDLDELQRMLEKAAEPEPSGKGADYVVETFKRMAFEQKLDAALRNAAPELIAMARRYQWLCEDHADAATRERCREILERMSVRSESANSAAIDAAMQEKP